MKFKLYNCKFPPCRWTLPFLAGLVLFFTAFHTNAQSYAYFEKYDAATFSRLLMTQGASPNDWNAMEKTGVRPWSKTEHTEKQVNQDGTFLIKTDHLTDDCFRIETDKPKQTLIDNNGIRVIDHQDEVVLNMPYSGPLLSQYPEMQNGFPVADIGQFPDFQPLTQAQISDLQAQGWVVTVLPNGQIEMVKPGSQITINPILMKYQIELLVENQIKNKLEIWYKLDSLNQIMPSCERLTDFETMSNGDCVHRQTITLFRNYVIDRPSSSAPREGKLPPGHQIASVMPNPVSEVLNLCWKESDEEVEVLIFDQLGRILRYIPELSGNTTQISMENIPSGNYFAVVQGYTTRQVVRFVKQ